MCRVRIEIPDRYRMGPRHDLAAAIWEEAGRVFSAEGGSVVLRPHDGDHRNALRSWWKRAHEAPEEIHVFTETDFLPESGFLASVRADLVQHDLVATMARHREDGNSEPVPTSEKAGGWLVVARPKAVPGVTFASNEPGNSLPAEFPKIRLLTGEWRDPGLYYPGYGLHTFWSRAWHDPNPLGDKFDHDTIMALIDGHLDHYRKVWNV
ncbi:MAG: hypothetical protein V3S01_12560 [Dehalococcoidia bacterium]